MDRPSDAVSAYHGVYFAIGALKRGDVGCKEIDLGHDADHAVLGNDAQRRTHAVGGAAVNGENPFEVLQDLYGHEAQLRLCFLEPDDGSEAAVFGHEFLPLRNVLQHDAEAAAQAARELGLPVALKLTAPGLAHKTEIGGVLLNVATA